MRILGVDYGDKRVGLAVTDEGCVMAHALKTVPRSTALRDILAVVTEYEVSIIVVGMPYNNKGEIAFKAKQVLKWLEELKAAVTVPVETYDERFTTFSAKEDLIAADVSRKRRDEVIDKLAAANILQGYLKERKENDKK